MKTMRNLWLAASAASVLLSILVRFGVGPESLASVVLVLNAAMFALALPCSAALVPAAFSAWYFLELNPLSAEGIYFNTFSLAFVGAVQWFLVASYWRPFEPQMLRIDG